MVFFPGDSSSSQGLDIEPLNRWAYDPKAYPLEVFQILFVISLILIAFFIITKKIYSTKSPLNIRTMELISINGTIIAGLLILVAIANIVNPSEIIDQRYDELVAEYWENQGVIKGRCTDDNLSQFGEGAADCDRVRIKNYEIEWSLYYLYNQTSVPQTYGGSLRILQDPVPHLLVHGKDVQLWASLALIPLSISSIRELINSSKNKNDERASRFNMMLSCYGLFLIIPLAVFVFLNF